ncbi:MAG: LSM domain-containing protein [Candidatus Bathyarchaeia archaeon]
MEPSKKPINVLTRCRNSKVRVKLKNDYEYVGKVVMCDSYMNMILSEAEELRGNDPTVNYGNIFIRGNNILYVRMGQV